MELITVNYENISVLADNMAKYDKVFSDSLGKLPGKVHLEVDKDVTPTAISSCRVPLSIKSKLKAKLQDLEKNKSLNEGTRANQMGQLDGRCNEEGWRHQNLY